MDPKDRSDKFVCFVLQMEALMFQHDSRLSATDVVRAVISKRRTIERTIRRTRNQCSKKGLPQRWIIQTEMLLTTPAFVDFVHDVERVLEKLQSEVDDKFDSLSSRNRPR